METPVADFVQQYAASGALRLHMPGHKGVGTLGCEALDITEIAGADALYEASGILDESERNAAALFGSGRTLYSTEGSSQCIRAMLYLAVTCRPSGTAPVIVAARNVHKAFVYAAALCGAEVVWLWPDAPVSSLCACPVTPAALEHALCASPAPPCAVYVTSPDYLGNLQDLPALAAVCRRHGLPLLVDNAHGAYLRFCAGQRHPLQCGAAICCDSAHKTLPVLTGGAYLHIARSAPDGFSEGAKAAMALFGSTRPSYLPLASLDLCNRRLAEDYPALLSEAARRALALRHTLAAAGWQTEAGDPLHLTLRGDGLALSQRLRAANIEPEYADRDTLVLLLSPEICAEADARVPAALGRCNVPSAPRHALPCARGETVMPPRAALFAPHETIPAARASGRICAAPTVACPPAIPIAVSGERIGADALFLFDYYGIRTVEVLR